MRSTEEEDENLDLDDPITLMDYEQARIESNLVSLEEGYMDEDYISEKDFLSENESMEYTSSYRKTSFVPVTFFDITNNIRLLNKCRPISIKVVDCDKYPWFYKKFHKKYRNKLKKTENCENKLTKTKDIIDISDDEDVIQIGDWPVTSSETQNLDANNLQEKKPSDYLDLTTMDFKRNKGLIGLKIAQTLEIIDVDNEPDLENQIDINESPIKANSNDNGFVTYMHEVDKALKQVDTIISPVPEISDQNKNNDIHGIKHNSNADMNKNESAKEFVKNQNEKTEKHKKRKEKTTQSNKNKIKDSKSNKSEQKSKLDKIKNQTDSMIQQGKDQKLGEKNYQRNNKEHSPLQQLDEFVSAQRTYSYTNDINKVAAHKPERKKKLIVEDKKENEKKKNKNKSKSPVPHCLIRDNSKKSDKYSENSLASLLSVSEPSVERNDVFDSRLKPKPYNTHDNTKITKHQVKIVKDQKIGPVKDQQSPDKYGNENQNNDMKPNVVNSKQNNNFETDKCNAFVTNSPCKNEPKPMEQTIVETKLNKTAVESTSRFEENYKSNSVQKNIQLKLPRSNIHELNPLCQSEKHTTAQNIDLDAMKPNNENNFDAGSHVLDASKIRIVNNIVTPSNHNLRTSYSSVIHPIQTHVTSRSNNLLKYNNAMTYIPNKTHIFRQVIPHDQPSHFVGPSYNTGTLIHNKYSKHPAGIPPKEQNAVMMEQGMGTALINNDIRYRQLLQHLAVLPPPPPPPPPPPTSQQQISNLQGKKISPYLEGQEKFMFGRSSNGVIRKFNVTTIPLPPHCKQAVDNVVNCALRQQNTNSSNYAPKNIMTVYRQIKPENVVNSKSEMFKELEKEMMNIHYEESHPLSNQAMKNDKFYNIKSGAHESGENKINSEPNTISHDMKIMQKVNKNNSHNTNMVNTGIVQHETRRVNTMEGMKEKYIPYISKTNVRETQEKDYTVAPYSSNTRYTGKPYTNTVKSKITQDRNTSFINQERDKVIAQKTDYVIRKVSNESYNSNLPVVCYEQASVPDLKKNLKRPLILPNAKKSPHAKKSKLDSTLSERLNGQSNPAKGYSPPILPIPSYKKTLEILTRATNEAQAQANKRNIELRVISSNKIEMGTNPRGPNIVHEKPDKSKKISLEEYMNRVSKESSRKPKQENNNDKNSIKTPKQLLEFNRSNDHDQGYDSDSTVVL